MTTPWTSRAGTRFTCEKRPAAGSKGMVVVLKGGGAFSMRGDAQLRGGNMNPAGAQTATYTIREP